MAQKTTDLLRLFLQRHEEDHFGRLETELALVQEFNLSGKSTPLPANIQTS